MDCSVHHLSGDVQYEEDAEQVVVTESAPQEDKVVEQLASDFTTDQHEIIETNEVAAGAVEDPSATSNYQPDECNQGTTEDQVSDYQVISPTEDPAVDQDIENVVISAESVIEEEE